MDNDYLWINNCYGYVENIEKGFINFLNDNKIYLSKDIIKKFKNKFITIHVHSNKIIIKESDSESGFKLKEINYLSKKKGKGKLIEEKNITNILEKKLGFSFLNLDKENFEAEWSKNLKAFIVKIK